jgi:hypothetical protein
MGQQQQDRQQKNRQARPQTRAEDGKGGKRPQEDRDASVSDDSQESIDREEAEKGAHRNN